MNRNILRIAVPSIVSNITVPLLSLVDTAIVGHLGAAAYIGAIALGGMIFNIIYWLCGFLRMGTGGLTAQAYGANQNDESFYVLFRSLTVAGCISLLLILFQKPIVDTVFRCVTAAPEVERYARLYFSLLIWGTPAVLGLYSFTGWFFGMQNAKIPMVIALTQNLANILISLSLVIGWGWKVEGVATGTLIAQYIGLLLAFILWRKYYHRQHTQIPFRVVFNRSHFSQFFQINRDIFLRTLCLTCVTTFFTSAGSNQGELVLASNTLLMQFYFFVSYIMDGFAYAGEALGGRFLGADEKENFTQLTHRLFTWGFALGIVITTIYFFFGKNILHLLTNEPNVIHLASTYLPFAVAIPLISLSAFLFDGLFIGTTSTQLMLRTMFVATALFFITILLLPHSNTSLWIAFLIYMGGRGVMQGIVYHKVIAKFHRSNKKNT